MSATAVINQGNLAKRDVKGHEKVEKATESLRGKRKMAGERERGDYNTVSLKKSDEGLLSGFVPVRAQHQSLFASLRHCKDGSICNNWGKEGCCSFGEESWSRPQQTSDDPPQPFVLSPKGFVIQLVHTVLFACLKTWKCTSNVTLSICTRTVLYVKMPFVLVRTCDYNLQRL